MRNILRPSSGLLGLIVIEPAPGHGDEGATRDEDATLEQTLLRLSSTARTRFAARRGTSAPARSASLPANCQQLSLELERAARRVRRRALADARR